MSDLPIHLFCNQQGVSQPSFCAKRRELAKRDREMAERRLHAANRRSRPVASCLPVQVVSGTPRVEAGSSPSW